MFDIAYPNVATDIEPNLNEDIDNIPLSPGQLPATIDLGPFKYYVSMFFALSGSPTHVSINSMYCKSAKVSNFWPHHPLLCWRNTWMVPKLRLLMTKWCERNQSKCNIFPMICHFTWARNKLNNFENWKSVSPYT